MAAAALLAAAAPVAAQSATDSAAVLVTATVNAKAKLTLSAASVTFADANPGAAGWYTSSDASGRTRTAKLAQ